MLLTLINPIQKSIERHELKLNKKRSKPNGKNRKSIKGSKGKNRVHSNSFQNGLSRLSIGNAG